MAKKEKIMTILSSIENSFIQQHVTLSLYYPKLGLSVDLTDSGWVVKDPQERTLLMSSRQVPKEIAALEEKLRRVFLN
ncbi:MAG: hypothetical protein LC437_06655 [Thiohalomonas sp.]|nr:hypothetical protein [Thiohalomonas sp.]